MAWSVPWRPAVPGNPTSPSYLAPTHVFTKVRSLSACDDPKPRAPILTTTRPTPRTTEYGSGRQVSDIADHGDRLTGSAPDYYCGYAVVIIGDSFGLRWLVLGRPYGTRLACFQAPCTHAGIVP